MTLINNFNLMLKSASAGAAENELSLQIEGRMRRNGGLSNHHARLARFLFRAWIEKDLLPGGAYACTAESKW